MKCISINDIKKVDIFNSCNSVKIKKEVKSVIKEPIKICGTYKYDYDINNIHKLILDSLYNKDVHSGHLNHKEYIKLTEDMIDEYNRLSIYKIIPKFGQKVILNEDDERRLCIIENYLKIASKYISIDLKRICDNVIKCPQCGEPGVKKNCYICGYCDENESIHRKNKGIIEKDDRCKNFLRAIDDFQGIDINIKDEDMNKINAYIKKNNILFYELTKNKIRKILKTLSMTEHYHAENYLYCKLHNIELPDISMLKEMLVEKFLLCDEIHYKIKDDSRTNGLSVSFYLNIFLLQEGAEIITGGSDTPITQDVKNHYNSIMKKICAFGIKEYPKFKWNYVTYF